jgi:long-chain acyl-CoA synthetase
VDAAKDPAVIAEVQKSIDAANSTVSRAESIRKFVILPEDFTEDGGHMTPKFSIKRNVILKDYAAQIEDLYSGSSVDTEAVKKVDAS